MNGLILALVLVGGVFTTATPQIAAHHGTTFLVALPSNPTTGYAWTARVRGSGIVSQGSAYQRPQSAGMGAGGQQVFSFDAVRNGTATITFSYARTWEKHVAPIKSAVFHVTTT